MAIAPKSSIFTIVQRYFRVTAFDYGSFTGSLISAVGTLLAGYIAFSATFDQTNQVKKSNQLLERTLLVSERDNLMKERQAIIKSRLILNEFNEQLNREYLDAQSKDSYIKLRIIKSDRDGRYARLNEGSAVEAIESILTGNLAEQTAKVIYFVYEVQKYFQPNAGPNAEDDKKVQRLEKLIADNAYTISTADTMLQATDNRLQRTKFRQDYLPNLPLD